ncbi:MAG: 16S rRNA methyltransferase [Proteobacteria bacterium]|nr:MAG: 16S rRNA methyltransferase [Pseudomonadota bacterium]
MQRKITLAVSGYETCPAAELAQLARLLGCPLYADAPDAQYVLHRSKQRLELFNPSEPNTKAIFADFVEGKTRHRRLFGGGKGQDLAKALGLQKFPEASVVDATAGLGSDAFVMATLGCRVTLLERNPVVQLLLSDALSRADESGDVEVQAIAARMRLVQSPAIDYLDALVAEDYPQLIYLDPMFPERGKQAQVKKAMRFFHDIVGEDADADQLLEIALQRAIERIIVKRPLRSDTLNERKPDFQIRGKTIRYDVYLGTRHGIHRPITS